MKLSLLLLWSLLNTPLQNANCQCQPSAGFDPCASGFSSGYGDFNSPCGDCRGRGGCKRCCKDSTCDMYQHYAYRPDNHGYYYFRPYNYPQVWKHQQWIANLGGDPRNPYSRAMFTPIYEQFENTTYEPEHRPSSTLSTLPDVGKQLPDLEQLMKSQRGSSPTAIEPPAPIDVPNPEPALLPETK